MAKIEEKYLQQLRDAGLFVSAAYHPHIHGQTGYGLASLPQRLVIRYLTMRQDT
jgi:hypothetical protein